MLSLKDRILAKIDQILGWDFEKPAHFSGDLVDFHQRWGEKMLILDEEGVPRALGGSFWVEHEYDGKGNLIRRTRVRDTVQDGEKIIYGRKKVDAAYLAYYQKYYPSFKLGDELKNKSG